MAAAEAVGARRMSSVYETAPQGEVLDQPDFLNAVVEIETDLGPEELLAECKRIESELGRRQGGVRHGPRPIDIDILLLGDLEYESERLRIPHRDLETRRFVLEPLQELAPEAVDEARLAAVADQRVRRLP
jgi:2-amino-4-hydroxy-6-hydroxymethyldihydropteridine diphosphokinase